MESHSMQSSSEVKVGEGMEAKLKQTKEVEEIQCQVKCKYFVICFIV